MANLALHVMGVLKKNLMSVILPELFDGEKQLITKGFLLKSSSG